MICVSGTMTYIDSLAHLAQTGSKNDNLIYFAHLLEEIIHARTLYDINIMPVVFDFDRHDIISLLY